MAKREDAAAVDSMNIFVAPSILQALVQVVYQRGGSCSHRCIIDINSLQNRQTPCSNESGIQDKALGIAELRSKAVVNSIVV